MFYIKTKQQAANKKDWARSGREAFVGDQCLKGLKAVERWERQFVPARTIDHAENGAGALGAADLVVEVEHGKFVVWLQDEVRVVIETKCPVYDKL